MDNRLVVYEVEKLICKMTREAPEDHLISYFAIKLTLKKLEEENKGVKNIQYFCNKLLRNCGAICGFEEKFEGKDYIQFALQDLQKIKSFDCLNL